MNKALIVGAAWLMLSAQPVKADSTPLLSKTLDASQIVQGLPLTHKTILKSGNGSKKVSWDIKGAESSGFEIIGNDQHDADTVSWSCHQFDHNGNSIKPNSPDTFCYQFFVKVLRNVVKNPDQIAATIMPMAVRNNPSTVGPTYGDITIYTDSNYFFIRRKSRM
ncbi:MAG TPA: hypothetical protein VFW42_10875 [Fluviicoccus sp.]|nr:hypothetical protein [Fluviicoccus sp.]